MKKLIIAGIMFIGGVCQAYPYLPNSKMTTGVASNSTLAEICSKGYPERSRDVTSSTKSKVYKLYNVNLAKCRGGCKIDHLIPLSIGGSNDIGNLWPHEYNQQWSVYKKTRLEVRLRRDVCAGKRELEQARQCIASNWTTCYTSVFGTTPPGK